MDSYAQQRERATIVGSIHGRRILAQDDDDEDDDDEDDDEEDDDEDQDRPGWSD